MCDPFGASFELACAFTQSAFAIPNVNCKAGDIEISRDEKYAPYPTMCGIAFVKCAKKSSIRNFGNPSDVWYIEEGGKSQIKDENGAILAEEIDSSQFPTLVKSLYTNEVNNILKIRF